MARSTISSGCKSAEDATWVAEALTSQIEYLNKALDSRSLFSAAFNRKMARKIEVLDNVRSEYLTLAADYRRLSASQEAAGRVLADG